MKNLKSEMINQTSIPGIFVSESSIDGNGCFAAVLFRQGQRIAEYVGERISFTEGERRRQRPGKKYICDVDREWSIDASRGGNGTQYVNHSCEPNAYLLILDGHVFLHALRKIVRGEEITIDYLFELQLENKECNCGTVSCVAVANLPNIGK